MISTEFYDKIIKKCNDGFELNNDDVDYIMKWSFSISKFHENRIEAIKSKQICFISHINNHINCVILKEYPQKTLSNPAIVDKILQVKIEFDKWIEHIDTFQIDANQKERAARVYAWSGYFKSVFALLVALGKQLHSVEPMSPPWNYETLELLRIAYQNNYSFAQPNTTPFTTQLNVCARLWASQENILVKIQGRENIDQILNEHNNIPVVNLFLPSHRSPIPDLMLLGHLDLPNYILCGNAKSFAGVPETLKYWIASQPEFIGVGEIKGEGEMTPTEKIIKALKLGLSKNIVNYPQAFVPSEGSILPISKTFVDKLIVPLILEGLIVRVIPIAYEVESEFLLNRKNHCGMVYTIKCGRPIRFNAIKTLVQIQLGTAELKPENLNDFLSGKLSGNGPRCFDDYLLTFWYETIQEHGELSYNELIKLANERYDISLNC